MTKPADPKNYIYPSRATACVPREATEIYGKMGFIAQLKYNDSRTLIKIVPNGTDKPTITLWNRHAARLKYTPPQELQEQLEQLPDLLGLDKDKWHLLDGGLLDSKHKAVKNMLVIWDILVKNGEHLLGTTYGERYDSLLTQTFVHTHGPHITTYSPNFLPGKIRPHHDPAIDNSTAPNYIFGFTITDNIFLPDNYKSAHWDNLWDMIDEINIPFTDKRTGEITPLVEGLVFKDLSGVLENGRKPDNNACWMSRSRVATKRARF